MCSRIIYVVKEKLAEKRNNIIINDVGTNRFKNARIIIVYSRRRTMSNYDDIIITVLGDPRSNQNPALLSFGILLFKWHNVIAGRVQLDHPEWSDEEVFQKARRFVIGTLQVKKAPRPRTKDPFRIIRI